MEKSDLSEADKLYRSIVETDPGSAEGWYRLGLVAEALKDPKIHETLIAQGAEPVGSTPDAFRTFIADQTKLWAVAVKDSGAQVE